MIYYQQGDVLLFEEKFSKAGLKKVKGALLHKGQNHHHRLSGGAFQIYEADGRRFLSISKGTKLTHEEHKTGPLPKGEYRIGIVIERDHFLEESRQVID